MNLFRLVPHPHRWRTSRVNSRQVVTEQCCTLCQRYRHHRYDDRHGPDADPRKWRKGKHPGNKS